jgi:hypothetical protein
MRIAYADPPYLGQSAKKPARTEKDADRHLIRDWVSVAPKMNSRVTGEKPYEFCFWLFEILGATQADELTDLFPGSGAVTEAWRRWRSELRLAV